jgi:hypothetical protein
MNPRLQKLLWRAYKAKRVVETATDVRDGVFEVERVRNSLIGGAQRNMHHVVTASRALNRHTRGDVGREFAEEVIDHAPRSFFDTLELVQSYTKPKGSEKDRAGD